MVSPHAGLIATRRHGDRDLEFECPADWLDRSVLVYSAPRDPKNPTAAPPNVVVRRDPAADGTTLRVHAALEITLLAKKLRSFELRETEDTRVSEWPAVSYRFCWQSPLGPLEQTITIVESGRENRRTFTTFLTTARTADAPSASAFFRTILQSVRFDASPAPSARPSVPPSRSSAPDLPALADPPFIPMPRFARR